MSYQSIHPTEVTEEERALGFERVLIQDKTHSSLNVPNLLVAVAYVLGPCARIVKMGNPDVRISYSHQAYGESSASTNSDWLAVLLPCESPAEAIDMARSKVDAEIARRQGLGIDPSLPSLIMRCADCEHSYRIRADHLNFEDPVTCPNCKKTRRARAAATYEVRPGRGGIKWARDLGTT
jgi:hypothetical protein